MSRNKSISEKSEVYAQFPNWKVNLVQTYFDNSLSSNNTSQISTTDDTEDVSTSIILDPSPSLSSVSSLAVEDSEVPDPVDVNSNMCSKKSFQSVKPRKKFIDKVVENEDYLKEVLTKVSVEDPTMETDEIDKNLQKRQIKVNGIVKIDNDSKSYLLIREILNDLLRNFEILEEPGGQNVVEKELKVGIESEPQKPLTSGIVDIDDEDDSDEEFPVMKKIVAKLLPLPMKKDKIVVNEVDSFSRIIVDDIFEDLLDQIVLNDPFVIARELPEEHVYEVVDSRNPNEDHEENDDTNAASVQESFDFPCSDIRYRTKPKTVVKETALSLFIFSPHTACVSKFIDEINKLRRRCIYERVGDSNQVVRLDYVFNEELDQKIFRNKVADLPLPQELILKMKSVPEELLLHREAPILSEEELLLICSDSLSENIFRGFSVRLREADNVFSFEFESMMILNTFLAIVLGLEKAFLGLIRQNARAYTPFKIQSIKKSRFKKKCYPMSLKYSFVDVDMKGLSRRYNFWIDTSLHHINRNSLIKVHFKNRKDFFRFLTSADSKQFDQINFEVEPCI